MKLTLKEFQEEAAADLARRISKASRDFREDGDMAALVLSAPTGAGKTVIATSLMERVVVGDEVTKPKPDAVFLWLTDQPELNEQTRKKILVGSDVFTDDSLVTVEAAAFDREVFEPGKVYFLNTQKLGKKSNLVARGDERSFTIWDTIANTVREYGADFWLIIDEAHRGMNDRNGNDKEATTLVQRLIKGTDDVPAVPLILGVSATPERFHALLGKTDRTVRHLEVDTEAVRASGLLKDIIRLHHTDEDQPSDVSLLAAAAERFKTYEERWAAYAEKEGALEVRPALVVQVADGTKAALTKTNLGDAITAIEGVLGPLSSDEVAHSFETGTTLDVSGLRIPYMAPSDIQDSSVRVVFFKMALSTGWDCPRAEVMMSFRTAKDETLIAQLVGRMVRTPLARQVGGDDLLNAVSLYLPHYSRDELAAVIARLSEPDPDNGLPPIVVIIDNEFVTLHRDDDRASCFDAAAKLPNYKVERVSRQTGVRRLLSLGRRLAWDGIDKAAPERFQSALVDVLDGEYARLKSDATFERRITEAGRIDVRTIEMTMGGASVSDVELSQIPVVDRNIEDAFAEAGRVLSGDLHNIYAQRRARHEGADALPLIKRETFALVQDPDVRATVEKTAEKTCGDELKRHQTAINGLLDDQRDHYRQLRRMSAKPIAEPWELPDELDGSATGGEFDKHLYIREDGGAYTGKLNTWEEQVLREELEKDEVVGWLRNEPRKPWSLVVPYKKGGENQAMYPDFIVFREVEGQVVCDVLEPHALSWSDSAAKAKGLAEFAKEHADQFGRIEFIAKTSGSELKRLDINDDGIRAKVLALDGDEHLRQLLNDIA